MNVATREYIYDLDDAHALLEDEAVDPAGQRHALRRVSAFLAIGALCEARHADLLAAALPRSTATSNGSMTTSASSACGSTGRRSLGGMKSRQTSMDYSSRPRTPNGFG